MGLGNRIQVGKVSEVNELALFTGAGGGLLGSRLLGWRTVCGVEIDPYCRRVLMQRQNDGMLDPFPIWDDVRTFDGTAWRGKVDVVTGGFPCQPFSTAGKRLGEADERNMWPETARILGEVRPRFALLENVPALIANKYFGRILGDVAAIGFDCRWGVFSAAATGAPHQRDRLYMLANSAGAGWAKGRSESGRHVASSGIQMAYAKLYGRIKSTEDVRRRQSDPTLRCEVGDPDSRRHEPSQNTLQTGGASVELSSWWATEPDMGRVVNGLAHRVDRLRAIGNGQVPAVVARAWQELSGHGVAPAAER